MAPLGTSLPIRDLKDFIDTYLIANVGVLQHFPAVSTAVALLAIGGALLTGVAVYVMAAVWIERKVCAHIQDRLGPMRVGWHGILQSIIDPIKLGLKEDLCPDAADKPLFFLAPFVVLCSSFATFVVIPFSERLVMANLDIGVLYVVSIGSGVLMGTVMAGWSSNNKWALFGAMRTVAMVVSYEIPIGMSLIPIVMITGSLNMTDITLAQAPWLAFTSAGHLEPVANASNLGILQWNIFRYFPFLFIGFIVFYTASLAECNRTPFDLAEAESELVAGFHTEYSGIRWSFFFLAEYADMLVLSMLGTVLYLGGWLPMQIFKPTTIDFYVFWLGMVAPTAWYLLGYLWPQHYIPKGEWDLIVVQAGLLAVTFVLLIILPEPTWFLLKSLAQVFIMIWLRWTLPRLRTDQLMYVCWKVLLPITFVNFLVVGFRHVYVGW
jgi:NADH-quinone oxidoreductase subunit H